MAQEISKEVENVFNSYPEKARERLLEIRQLIFTCASEDDAIGQITETLKWGEPAYLTEQSGSGSTIRLGFKDSQPATVAIYFNCQTTIVKDIQQRFTGMFECVDNRAVLISLKDPLASEEVSECIALALRYHVNKKARSAGLI